MVSVKHRRRFVLLAVIGLAVVAACSSSIGVPATGGPSSSSASAAATGGANGSTSASIAPPTGQDATSAAMATATSRPDTPLSITDTVLINQGQEGTVLDMQIPITDNAAVNDVLMSWAAVRRSSFTASAWIAIEAATKAAAAQAPPPPAPSPPGSVPVPVTTTPTTPAPVPIPVPSLSVRAADVEPGVVDGLVRVRTEQDLGDGATVSHLSLYRVTDSHVVFGGGLIDPAQRQALVELVRSRVPAAAPDASEWSGATWPGAVLGSILTDLQLGADGSLTATVEPRLLADTTEPVTVRLPPEEAGPLLSRDGRWLLGDDAAAPSALPPDCSVDRCVALTFDDGPGPDTPRLLNVLSHAGIRATFFMIGLAVQKRPAVAKAVGDAGHEIGNHTWSHPRLGDLDQPTQEREVSSTEAEISAVTGVTAELLRPPAGAYDDDTRNLGFGIALWNVDTRDWQHRDPARTVERALVDTAPGSIVLLHDLYASTVDSSALIIAGLRTDGYRFLTMSDLVGVSVPGSLYYALGRIEPLGSPPAAPGQPVPGQPVPSQPGAGQPVPSQPAAQPVPSQSVAGQPAPAAAG